MRERRAARDRQQGALAVEALIGECAGIDPGPEIDGAGQRRAGRRCSRPRCREVALLVAVHGSGPGTGLTVLVLKLRDEKWRVADAKRQPIRIAEHRIAGAWPGGIAVENGGAEGEVIGD